MDLLFYLLRLGLGFSGDVESCPVLPSDWSDLFRISAGHGVLGSAFAGIEKLEVGQRPASVQLLQWIAAAENIRRRNVVMNGRCDEVCRLLESAGLDCCMLKGQGMALLYPEPSLRQAGDIDVWVKPRAMNQGHDIDDSIGEIRKRLASIDKGRLGKMVYHHVEWYMPGVMVEVHFRPLQLNAPLANRRFQRWCNEQWQGMQVEADRQDGSLAQWVPSKGFNAVYLLAHMYHHLLFEGLAMKQVCDYAVLLNSGAQEDRKEELVEALRQFGMLRFACGMMWVMGEVFHIGQDKMIVEPDEVEGRFILNEIIGERGKLAEGKGWHEPVAAKFWRRTKYRSRFLSHYPSEILWDIPFRLYHWYWRRRLA